MIRCLSCRKSSDNSNLYLVKLISNMPLKKMPTSGKDVIGLANSAMFAIGSELIVCVNKGTQKYVYGEKGFISENGTINGEDNNPLRFVIDDDGAVYIG